jgi:hypothetical protein
MGFSVLLGLKSDRHYHQAWEGSGSRPYMQLLLLCVHFKTIDNFGQDWLNVFKNLRRNFEIEHFF